MLNSFRRLKNFALYLSALQLLLVSTQAQSAETPKLSEKDRALFIEQLTASQKKLQAALAGLSEEQMRFKSAPERWSIAEVAEHLTLGEDFLRGILIKQILQSPTATGKKSYTTDEAFMAAIRDRSLKAEAPPQARPKQSWATVKETMQEFEQRRAKTLDFVKATTAPSGREKTGKSFAEWQQLARASQLAKHGEIVKFLKTEHGLSHGYANLVAHEVLQSAAGNFAKDDLIAAQYAGAKAALRPIYDALVAAIQGLGDDVEFAPKKAYVSLRRKKQFGCLQPLTVTRLDVDLNLKGVAPAGRLEASGSFNAMVSHRVRVGSVQEVDAELIGWLRRAYEQS